MTDTNTQGDDQGNQTPQGDDQGNQTPQGDDAKNVAPELVFEAWFAGLPKEQQTMVEGHVAGLKTALRSERATSGNLQSKLRDLTKLAEKGSELEGQLQKMSEDLRVEAAKAEFFDAAHAQRVTNLRLAWLAAQDEGLVDLKTGACDFDKLRASVPELFAKTTTPAGNAGNGTSQAGVKTLDMNTLLRQAAGRG